MSTKLQYNGFKINKLEYQAEDNNENSNTDDLTVNVNFDSINISYIDKDKKLFLKISGTINISTDAGKILRYLNLNVTYLFDVKDPSEDQLEEVIKDYGVNIALTMYEELIHHITSLDYMGPITINELKIPNDFKLEKEA